MRAGIHREYRPEPEPKSESDKRLSQDHPEGESRLGRFLFCPEVIARGHEAAQALPAPRMRGADQGRILPETQAKAGRPAPVRPVAQLVQPAHLDGGPSAWPAAPGTLLPGVRPARHPHAGHRRGPCAGSPGRLGAVHRPGQSPEPVPLLPQPQDHAGVVAKPEGKFRRWQTVSGPALGAGARSGCAGGRGREILANFLHPPPGAKKFRRDGVRPQASLRVGFFPHGNFQGKDSVHG